jgi:hypothetical protein
MTIADDIDIRINVHELRILGIWAENYAIDCDLRNQDNAAYESMKATINKIATVLEKQIEKAIGRYVPLTFTHELQEIPKHIKCGEITHIRNGREILIDEELS